MMELRSAAIVFGILVSVLPFSFLLERPGERFKIGWFNITDMKFFEELVLAEAGGHVAAGRFDEAYEYFHFLETKFPKTAGLKEAFENYLWLQSGSEYKAGDSTRR